MPKLTMTFTLPEEQEEFELASNGASLHCALHSFDRYLRDRLKYEELPEAIYVALEAVRAKLWEELNDCGVSL